MTTNSQRWLSEHRNDTYVKQAQHAGYRSRAVYKLAQIDARDHLLHPDMTIIDLGAAPGGWSQWVTQRLANRVRVFALDILPMASLPGVTFIQGDFSESLVLNELLQQLGSHPVHLVMSDMSPNLSGIKDVDQARAMLLVELARDLACQVLAPGGHLLTKVFQGEGLDSYLKGLRNVFQEVVLRKPQASRQRSSELYILAKRFRQP